MCRGPVFVLEMGCRDLNAPHERLLITPFRRAVPWLPRWTRMHLLAAFYIFFTAFSFCTWHGGGAALSCLSATCHPPLPHTSAVRNDGLAERLKNCSPCFSPPHPTHHPPLPNVSFFQGSLFATWKKLRAVLLRCVVALRY